MINSYFHKTLAHPYHAVYLRLLAQYELQEDSSGRHEHGGAVRPLLRDALRAVGLQQGRQEDDHAAAQ